MPGPRQRPDGTRGAPSLLTPEVEKLLIDATRAAVPVDLAAMNAGIGRTTFLRWLARGRDEEDRREDGQPPEPAEQPYFDLWQNIAQARAQSAVRGVLQIQSIAKGGLVTEETTKRYKDPQTGQLVEETTVKRTPPDWRAQAFLLKTQHARAFNEKQSIELTGENGAPIEVRGSGVDTDALAAKVAGNMAAALAAAQGTRALTSGDDDGVVDGDVVDG